MKSPYKILFSKDNIVFLFTEYEIKKAMMLHAFNILNSESISVKEPHCVTLKYSQFTEEFSGEVEFKKEIK